MTNVLLWAEANVRFDVLTDVEVIVPTGVVIALEFAVTVSHPVDVMVDMLIDALADVTIGVLFGIGIDVVLAGVDVGIFATALMAILEFTMSTPRERFNFWAACDCRPMTNLNWDRILQAWIPSYHVWWTLALPALPQFPDQEPPRPQQLRFPDFLMVPHLRHAELIAVVVDAGVHTRALTTETKLDWSKKQTQYA